jgi:hypothetical protein
MEETLLMVNTTKKITLLLIFTFISIYHINLFSQEYPVKVSASVDSTNVLIGDQINFTFKVEYLKNVKLTYPRFADSIGRLLIINKSKIDTTISDKSISLKQNIVLTCFDSGYYQIPPIEFSYKTDNDTNSYFSSSNPLFVKFFSVDIDTTKPIKDIKPPLELPFSIWDYIWYFIGLLGFVALGLAVFYFIYKRKPKLKEIQRFDPKIPAHIQAIKELDILESEKLWQNGKVKEYYSRLTDILRLYLERRFSFPALESTTSEIMEQIKVILSGSDILLNLRFVLELADLVKFAKNIPLPEENSRVMELSRNIVESTIPIELESENGGQSNG